MSADDPIKNEPEDESPDEGVKEFMENHDLDQDTAEHVQEIIEEYGVDEDDPLRSRRVFS